MIYVISGGCRISYGNSTGNLLDQKSSTASSCIYPVSSHAALCCGFGITEIGDYAKTGARTLLIAENVGVTISPLTPAVFLGLGALDLDLGEHIRYSVKWIWPVSILSVVIAVMIGVIPM